ncbi:hypothetical protein HJC23_010848, partial [Cyclotella cryptica]
ETVARGRENELMSGNNGDDDFAIFHDNNLREQRWGDMIEKIEDYFAHSDQEEGRGMVPFRGSATAPSNPWFSVMSAPGTASNFHSLSSGDGSPFAISNRTIREWIKLERKSMAGEVSEIKRYFERSVCILYSLVLKTIVTVMQSGKAEMDVAVHPELITVENIMVDHSLEDGETAHFLQTESEDHSFLDGVATKYEAMKALGIVSYELLMKGSGPLIATFLPSALAPPRDVGRLKLCSDDLDDTNASDRHQKRKVPRSALDGNPVGITAAMLNAGVPYPLCRFTIDLLGGESSEGMVFRDDSAFDSFLDVLADLKQMMENPEAFIHLSVKDQWRLAFGEKMHGRDSEKKMIMDVASRLTGTTTNDVLFEALAALVPKNKQQVVMVTGKPGSGKSRLVMEARKSLEMTGWFFLSCKFDRIIHAEPLSVIAGAFDEFLEQCLLQSQHEQLRKNIKESMLPDDLSILVKHVPSLIKYIDHPLLPPDDVEMSKEQIHHLFSQLLELFSSTGKPIAFFVDDLQWADAASIDLFLSLIKSSDLDLSSTCCSSKVKPNILFIGSCRENKVDNNHKLTQMLAQLKGTASVEITTIAVCGFDQDTLNQIVSQSLCLPLRRTKPLSNIILQKTDGIVIHIIEFIGRLTMDRILCHSFVKGWEWDSEVIEGCPISDSVAELFAFKLKKLPPDSLFGLQVCSIFGTYIDQRLINFVKDFDGENSVNINDGLKVALDMGLVEMAGNMNVFKFAHDIIAQAAFDLIQEEERPYLLQKLAAALIRNATAANELDSVIFVAVDLINRISNEVITDPNERVLYASMNEKAGKKALAVPDFCSAVKYSESGLSLLGIGHWETHHDLSLGLYQTSVVALYSCNYGNQELLRERINAVCQHAACLDEEFKTRYVWISLLSTSSFQDAINECHTLLERLGEPIDTSVEDPTHLCSELVKVKEAFLEKKQDFSMITRMVDPNKLKAMKIMSSLLVFYHHQRSSIGVLVSSRMVEMSMKFGYCEDSLFGLSSIAAVVVCNLGEIDEGCSWARMVLAHVSKSRHNINELLPAVYAACYGFVLIWQEPLQATLDPIIFGCRLGFDYGNIQFAVSNAKIEVLAQKCAQYGQLAVVQTDLSSIYNVLRGLKGLSEQALAPLDHFINNDELLNRTMNETDEIGLHMQVMLEITFSFIFRNMEKAQAMVDMIGDDGQKSQLLIGYIIIDFYAGLTASYFARKTGEEKSKFKAQNVRDRMECLLKHSKWNFENKFLLLKAECHYTEGEISEATKYYEAAITSARQHKFANEEAVACELAGYFFQEQGDETNSATMFKQAYFAYLKWGAVHKAKTLFQVEIKCSDEIIQSGYFGTTSY